MVLYTGLQQAVTGDAAYEELTWGLMVCGNPQISGFELIKIQYRVQREWEKITDRRAGRGMCHVMGSGRSRPAKEKGSWERVEDARDPRAALRFWGFLWLQLLSLDKASRMDNPRLLGPRRA